MKTVYIFAGHSIRSNGIGTGAFYQENGKVVYENKLPKYDEAVLVREFVTLLAKELYSKYQINTITDKDDWSLVDTIKFAASKAKVEELIIDIHFNAAGNPKATGTEVLVPKTFKSEKDKKKEMTLGAEIAKVIGETLGIPTRGGVKTGYPGVKYSNESQHSSIGILDKLIWGTNLLIEICFISNPDEMKKYTERKELLAKKIAKVIAENI